MEEEEIKTLTELLNERTMALMARETDLADRKEEIEAQQEEITAAVEEVQSKNKVLVATLDQLQERNQELDEILYRFSHDLRSPVASILGILSLFKYESLTDSMFSYFSHIRSKSVQMEELLNSVSVLSKTINSDIHFSDFQVEELINICIKDSSVQPNFPKVIIETRHLGKPSIHFDRFLTSIIVKNLLINAIVYRDLSKNGSITINTILNDGLFEIEISDDGDGISDQVKDHIFKMFYRGSERSTGSGLGLYVVKKIVEQLNGTVSFFTKQSLTSFKVNFKLH